MVNPNEEKKEEEIGEVLKDFFDTIGKAGMAWLALEDKMRKADKVPNDETYQKVMDDLADSLFKKDSSRKVMEDLIKRIDDSQGEP